jgi:uncharacterized protein YutE (UPF0331/DUF86 family)
VTDISLVLAKLTMLREQIARLERRRPDTLEAFSRDIDLQDALALSLMVALQEAADIALHLASDEGWGVPSSFAEAFDLLSRHGVIDAVLAKRMVHIASVRNRIAHGYASLDFERLWRETPGGVQSFREFAAAIATYFTPTAK